MVKKIICKKTYGISVCRYNNNKLEILMVKKRYTYAFFSFVFGYYKKYNNKQLKNLFNNMTLEEKIDILSLNFSIMWYRIWLTNPEQNYNFYNIYKNIKHTNNGIKNTNLDKISTDVSIDHNLFFYKKKKIFEEMVLKDDGKKLSKLIQSSFNYNLEWEIPKGGSLLNESNVLCACRELEEETNIKVDDYVLLHDINPIKYTNVDYKITYITNYYIAYLKNSSTYKPLINFNNKNQISEISDIQWLALNDIKKKNINNCKMYNTYNELENIYKLITKEFKKKIKIYYYDKK